MKETCPCAVSIPHGCAIPGGSCTGMGLPGARGVSRRVPELCSAPGGSATQGSSSQVFTTWAQHPGVNVPNLHTPSLPTLDIPHLGLLHPRSPYPNLRHPGEFTSQVSIFSGVHVPGLQHSSFPQPGSPTFQASQIPDLITLSLLIPALPHSGYRMPYQNIWGLHTPVSPFWG